MQGDLRTTSLDQLCRTLDEREATGELTITHDDQKVVVWFHDGRVTRASTSGPEMRLGDRLVHGGLVSADDLDHALGRQRQTKKALGEVLVEEGHVSRHVVRVFTQEQVLDAMFASFRWTRGEYKFDETELEEVSVPSDLTVSQLLFALESRHRRWNEITRMIPDMSAVPEFVPGADRSATSLEPGEASVVGRINGERSLEQIASTLGYGPFEVATVVHGLTVLGLVRLQAPDEAIAVPAPVVETPAPAPFEPVAAPESSTSNGLEDLALQLADLEEFGQGAAPAPDDNAIKIDEPRGPALAAAEVDDDDGPTFVIAQDDDVDDDYVYVPPPRPAASDDDDMAPWSFTIEGEGGGTVAPAPRPASGGVITASVEADPNTGTPLPGRMTRPGDLLKPAQQPAAVASADEPEEDSHSQGQSKADLLKELRQLTGE